MRFVKRITDDLVDDNSLLAKITYKNSVIIMSTEGIVYKNVTNSKKKQCFDQMLSFYKPYLYITPSQILTLTAIKKDGKSYMVLEELSENNKKSAYILDRKSLVNFLSENSDRVIVQDKKLVHSLSIPSEEELLNIYKKEFTDLIFSSLTQIEKTNIAFNEYLNMDEYPEKTETLTKLVNKMTIEDIPKNYSFKKIFGNLVLCQSCNNQLSINILEIYYLEKDKYKMVLTNVPIKEYKPKTKIK